MADYVRTYTQRLDDEGVVIAINTINEDGSVSNIPLDLENSDYQAYLAWLENPEAALSTPSV